MSASQEPRKRLPENPSEENLRKQAKQLAREEGIPLAAAQRRLAIEYGYRNWAELMRAVGSRFVPMIPLRELVAFPQEVYPVYVGRPKSISSIDAVAAGSPILLIGQRDAAVLEPSVRDMYDVGTLGVIVERQSMPDGTPKIMVEGRKRAKVKRFVFDEQYYKAEVEELADTERLNFLYMGLSRSDRDERVRALFRSVLSALHAHARLHPRTFIGREIRLEDPGVSPYMIARHLKIGLAEQQALLECLSPVERLEKILGYLEAAS
jgi:ATP-dependent Lon protease